MKKLVHVAIVSSFVLAGCASSDSINAAYVPPVFGIVDGGINLDGVIDADGSDTGYDGSSVPVSSLSSTDD